MNQNVSVGLAAQVQLELHKLLDTVMKRHPDAKHNSGREYLEAFVWDTVQKLAKSKSDQVWDRMEKSGIYEKPLKTGKHECGQSPHFIIKATVSEPVKRFNEAELARVLEASTFKVPPHMTKGFVAAAKVEGNPMVRVAIEERYGEL